MIKSTTDQQMNIRLTDEDNINGGKDEQLNIREVHLGHLMVNLRCVYLVKWFKNVLYH